MKNKLITLFFLTVFILLDGSYCFAVSFDVAGVSVNKKVKPMLEIKKENITSQSLDYSCGPAGLSTLFNYYLNDPVKEEDIISNLLQTVPLEKVRARRGFSLLDLKNFAQARGYKVVGYKMDLEFLKKLDKPVLVPIKFRNYRHFVVIKALIGDRVFIADPAAGNVSMKANKFAKLWVNGIGLVVEHENNKNSEDYALKVTEEDLVLSNYNNMQRLAVGSLLRTAIFTDEF